MTSGHRRHLKLVWTGAAARIKLPQLVLLIPSISALFILFNRPFIRWPLNQFAFLVVGVLLSLTLYLAARALGRKLFAKQEKPAHINYWYDGLGFALHVFCILPTLMVINSKFGNASGVMHERPVLKIQRSLNPASKTCLILVTSWRDPAKTRRLRMPCAETKLLREGESRVQFEIRRGLLGFDWYPPVATLKPE